MRNNKVHSEGESTPDFFEVTTLKRSLLSTLASFSCLKTHWEKTRCWDCKVVFRDLPRMRWLIYQA